MTDDGHQRERNDCLDDAIAGRLAPNDQRWQRIKRRAAQGVPADIAVRDQINEAGGPHNGSVGHVF